MSGGLEKTAAFWEMAPPPGRVRQLSSAAISAPPCLDGLGGSLHGGREVFGDGRERGCDESEDEGDAEVSLC